MKGSAVKFSQILFFLTLFSNIIFAAEAPALHPNEDPYLSEWIDKALRAKPNYQLGFYDPYDLSQGPKRPTTLISYLRQKTYNKMSSLLKWYKTLKVRELVRAEQWTQGKTPWRFDFNTFQPYSERIDLPEEVRVFAFGDFHGDIISFGGFLRDLRDKGVLDERFELKNENDYILFLGDYVDRGCYGMEVVYTILRLMKANPQRVKAVRGNHEDFTMCQYFGFLDELRAKLGDNYGRKLFDEIKDFHELMPVGFVFGHGEDWVLGCHGGLEHGYDLNPLLTAPAGVRFDMVNPLNRASFYNSLKAAGREDLIILYMIEEEPFFLKSPTEPFQLGLMWNDFVHDPEGDSDYKEGRGYEFSRDFTRVALPLLSSRLRAVFRAHQHSGEVLDHLLTHGLFRFWRDDSAERLELPVEQGDVFMFNVALDSAQLVHHLHHLATYGELRVKRNFADWRVVKHSISLKDELYPDIIYETLKKVRDEELAREEEAKLIAAEKALAEAKAQEEKEAIALAEERAHAEAVALEAFKIGEAEARGDKDNYKVVSRNMEQGYENPLAEFSGWYGSSSDEDEGLEQGYEPEGL